MESHPEYDRIATVIASVEAPVALRARIAAERDRTFTRRMVVKRMKLTGAMAGFAAALGVAVALVAPSGSPAPSFGDALALAGKPANAAAPVPIAAHPTLLNARVGDVSFPTWAPDIPWKAVGQRTDTISGRRAVTVFYDNPAGVRLSYTIVDGKALAWPSGAKTVVSHGIEVHLLNRGGQVVAVWREHGHSCVMSAPTSVPADRMIALAANAGDLYA